MAKQAEIARQTIAAQCEPGEQVRSVGLCTLASAWALLSFWLVKDYWIGITNKRLIAIRLDALSKPVTTEVNKVPLGDVILDGNKILVKLPGKEKPQAFIMRFGLKAATGFDVNEFKAALGQ